MIFCCGEALIDMLPISTSDGIAALHPIPGGAAFNTAIALGRLGVPVSFFSGLSSDPFGQIIQSALRESDVDFTFATISPLPTTLAFVTLSSGQPNYFFYDESTAGRMLEAEARPRLPDQTKALLFSGISLASEPCGSTYESLMQRESSARVIYLDPNIRPDFIPSATDHRLRLRRMYPLVDILKVSMEDLDWMEPDLPLNKAILSILDAGTKLIILTAGEHGAQAFWCGGSMDIPAVPVQAVDTIGAGDTFNAGVIAALLDQGALDKQSLASPQPCMIKSVLGFAALIAAITVSRSGANPPWRHELA